MIDLPFLANWIRYCCPFSCDGFGVRCCYPDISTLRSATMEMTFWRWLIWFAYCSIVKWKSLENKIAVSEHPFDAKNASIEKIVNYRDMWFFDPFLTAIWKWRCGMICMYCHRIQTTNRSKRAISQTPSYLSSCPIPHICSFRLWHSIQPHLPSTWTFLFMENWILWENVWLTSNCSWNTIKERRDQK